MDRMRAGAYLKNQTNCNYEMYILFRNPYCWFLVCLLLVKRFKHTHNSGEHRKPHPTLCSHHLASTIICPLLPLHQHSLFWSGVCLKTNSKHHIISCSPNTSIYKSKKKNTFSYKLPMSHLIRLAVLITNPSWL